MGDRQGSLRGFSFLKQINFNQRHFFKGLLPIGILILVSTLVGCSSAQKQRKEQREKVVQTSGLYCEFVNGELFADIDVALNLEMAKRCDPNRNFTISSYRTPSNNQGVLYCCATRDAAKSVSKNSSSPSPVVAPARSTLEPLQQSPVVAPPVSPTTDFAPLDAPAPAAVPETKPAVPSGGQEGNPNPTTTRRGPNPSTNPRSEKIVNSNSDLENYVLEDEAPIAPRSQPVRAPASRR